MKMEAKKLNIDLQLLYVNEQELYMSSCMPEYNQSPFLGKADHAETTEEPAGDAGRSSPKADSPKKSAAEGEPTREADHSPPRANPSQQDVGT